MRVKSLENGAMGEYTKIGRRGGKVKLKRKANLHLGAAV